MSSSDHHSHASSLRPYAFAAIKVAVSLGLLAMLFSRIDGARLWAGARKASLPWLGVALALYGVNVLASIWRWRLLLETQKIHLRLRTLLSSFLVALFFNNFLPSNIGGDVIRIRDSARAAKSTKTVATTVILADRVFGLLALVLVAAVGATLAPGAVGHAPPPIWAFWLWAGLVLVTLASAPALVAPAGVVRLLQPLTVFHPEWVGSRMTQLTTTLERFRAHPGMLISCFGGAVFVQASIVLYYLVVAYSLHVQVPLWDLAIIVPISFVVQMLPISLNGFGVREATFTFYFSRLGLPIESALLVSLVAIGLVMLFSLSGAAVYVSRRH